MTTSKPATAQDIFKVDDATALQMRAADPLKCIWVGASAGTGKTKVLIDRVLRLMLPRPELGADSATRPEKILCLTFTKTAAAEMSNRIYHKLSEWAVMDDEKLRAELLSLIGTPPTHDIEQEARRLFARVLDTPGGLNIMTIHSFCQSVLKRFPVEAGLPPHFELMDEQNAVEYLTKCLHDMLAEARLDQSSTVAKSFQLLALYLNPQDMSDLMSFIMGKRHQMSALLHLDDGVKQDITQAVQKLYQYLEINPSENEDTVLDELIDLPTSTETKLRELVGVLVNGSKTEQQTAEKLQDFLAHPDQRKKLFEFYYSAFFTGTGTVRANFMNKGTREKHPDLNDAMALESERLMALNEKLKAVRMIEINKALMTISAEMIGRYTYYKHMTDKLDYEDLIIKTSELLTTKDMINWVLFKLDSGIDHILVDEAQDTGPGQWNVVRALANEFFEPHGSRENVMRTLFVVGDEKQSIYSFQGADPAKFDEMRKYFGERVLQSQEEWEISLKHSFRSTKTVLGLTDKVFEPIPVRTGVVSDISRDIQHLVFRQGHAGLVEIWPLLTAVKKEETEDIWQMPTEIVDGDQPMVRLAHKIADTIKGWIDRGEILPSKNRPIRAGDVLILVQSRGALVETLMRALKERQVNVAGIDRMTLTDEISVMDLIALASFALLPRDDLMLATVLKNPIIGMDEDMLFKVCYNRQHSLWQNVQNHAPDVSTYLSDLIEKAGKVTPYEFFADILNKPCPADGVSAKRAMFSRLGYDIQDPLDEFLNQSLHFEQSHTPSLQSFVHWFNGGDAEIKREQEQKTADQVRIMTVHGAKGLQAPIVFLPDATKIMHDHNKGTPRLLLPSDDEADGWNIPLWSPRSEMNAEKYQRLQDKEKAKQQEEYRRLLYVAMTRAEDRLYVAGSYTSRKPKEDCWYHLIADAFDGQGEQIIDGTDAEGNDTFIQRIIDLQTVPPKEEEALSQDQTPVYQELPKWITNPPMDEPDPPTPLAPSKPDEEEPAVNSPRGVDDSWKFKRGNIIHHILQFVPDLPMDMRAVAIEKYLKRPSLDLSAADQKIFRDEIMTILTDDVFAPIFGDGSRAEVPLVGLMEQTGEKSKILSGQIDRLLVTDDEILIVDYKTNRPPPKDPENIAPIYLKQLAAYKSALSKIYGKRQVKCALLWTDIPRLMVVPDNLLDPYMLS